MAPEAVAIDSLCEAPEWFLDVGFRRMVSAGAYVVQEFCRKYGVELLKVGSVDDGHCVRPAYYFSGHGDQAFTVREIRELLRV